MMHYNASGSASLDKRKQRFGIKTVYKGLGVTVVEMAEALQRCEEADSKHQQIKLGSQPSPSPVPNTHCCVSNPSDHPCLSSRAAAQTCAGASVERLFPVSQQLLPGLFDLQENLLRFVTGTLRPRPRPPPPPRPPQPPDLSLWSLD